MRHDGRPPLEKDKEIRIPWELLREAGVTAGILRVYGSIRSHAGFEPAADNFLLAWPRVATIAKEGGVSRYTVSRATDWLEERDYLIIWRRPNKTSTYGVIVQRDHFRRFAAKRGRAEAIVDWEARRAELDEESRAEATSRNGKPRRERATGRKPHARNSPPRLADQPSPYEPPVLQGCGDQMCTDAASGVAGMRHGSVLQLNCVEKEIRGATDAALVSPSPSELPKGNSNGQDLPRETATHRCTQHGNSLKSRYLSVCPDCQDRIFWSDRFYADTLRKMGLSPPVRAGAAS